MNAKRKNQSEMCIMLMLHLTNCPDHDFPYHESAKGFLGGEINELQRAGMIEAYESGMGWKPTSRGYEYVLRLTEVPFPLNAWVPES